MEFFTRLLGLRRKDEEGGGRGEGGEGERSSGINSQHHNHGEKFPWLLFVLGFSMYSAVKGGENFPWLLFVLGFSIYRAVKGGENFPRLLFVLGFSIYRAVEGLLRKVGSIFYQPKPPHPLLPPHNPATTHPLLLPTPTIYSSSSSDDDDDRVLWFQEECYPAMLCSTSHSHSILENTLTSITVTNDEEENKEEEECENEESSYSLERNEIDSEVLVYGAEIGCSNAVISTEEIVEEEEGDVKVEVKNIVTVNEKERKIKHYRSSHKILLVGEGDFSFSACLALAFGSATNIVATSLNKLAFLKKNYGNAESNIMEIRSRGGRVMHGIDATKIANHQLLPLTKYDRIVFNFPFAGIFRKLPPESQLKRHRRLVCRFLKNAKEMISEKGEIHISHKTNGIHAEFKLESIASSHGLRQVKAVKFKLRDYPGYNTKFGFGGDGNFNCNPSLTFKFALKTAPLL